MIAVVSDIHGNLAALRAVLNAIDLLGCDRIISLGDVTGYYAEPGECIDLLIERNAIQLLGNHDEYLVSGTGCPRSRLVSDLLVHQRKAVTSAHIEFMSGLGSRHDEGECSFVHGGWSNPLDQYLYQVSSDILPDEGRYFFSGHTHVQILTDFGGKFYCNPGSVGQPRDGDSRAAFAVLGEDGVKLHRVEYDIDATVLAMKKAGFEDSVLWDNLYIGAQIGGRIDKIFVE
ncbi:metallophosphatase family protein [Gammaproteobacteria bacterium]|nr:metallophosphatase family protein [Gammaproteobacteria bacterium]